MLTAIEYWVEADENGKIEIGLPKNFPKDGKIKVVVMAETPPQPAVINDETPWTEEEIAEFLKPRDPSEKPLTGAEIVKILMEDTTPSAWDDAPDGVTWVRQQREARRKRLWGEQSE